MTLLRNITTIPDNCTEIYSVFQPQPTLWKPTEHYLLGTKQTPLAASLRHTGPMSNMSLKLFQNVQRWNWLLFFIRFSVCRQTFKFFTCHCSFMINTGEQRVFPFSIYSSVAILYVRHLSWRTSLPKSGSFQKLLGFPSPCLSSSVSVSLIVM